MFELDHVALQTPDIPAAVRWYVDQFGAQVIYADDTWAFLRIGQGKLALVRPEQHPGHVALRTDLPTLQRLAAQTHLSINTHRDGTQGLYLRDPAGNMLELICYPPDPTYPAKAALPT